MPWIQKEAEHPTALRQGARLSSKESLLLQGVDPFYQAVEGITAFDEIGTLPNLNGARTSFEGTDSPGREPLFGEELANGKGEPLETTTRTKPLSSIYPKPMVSFWPWRPYEP